MQPSVAQRCRIGFVKGLHDNGVSQSGVGELLQRELKVLLDVPNRWDTMILSAHESNAL